MSDLGIYNSGCALSIVLPVRFTKAVLSDLELAKHYLSRVDYYIGHMSKIVFYKYTSRVRMTGPFLSPGGFYTWGG